MYSTVPDPPGIYRSTEVVRERGWFYALGHHAELLGCDRPKWHESDEEVVARLMALAQHEHRPSTMALINADSLRAHGFDPAHHRPLSLPRLVR
jgi:hypothetical protein